MFYIGLILMSLSLGIIIQEIVRDNKETKEMDTNEDRDTK
jgi:hypothetical protein